MRTGSNRPQTAKDEYTLGLWQKHGLGENPTFAEMEATVTRLLADPDLVMEGVSMVLRRRVDSNEKDILKILAYPLEQQYAYFLVQGAIETFDATTKTKEEKIKK